MKRYLKASLSYNQTFLRDLPDYGLFSSLKALQRYARGKVVLDPEFCGLRFRAVIHEDGHSFWTLGVVGNHGSLYLSVPALDGTAKTVVDQSQVHWLGDWAVAIPNLSKHFAADDTLRPLWAARLMLSDISLIKTVSRLDQLQHDMNVYVNEKARGDRKRFECFNQATDNIRQFLNFSSWFEACLERDFPCQIIQE